MTGVRPNGRHTCVIRARHSIALDSAGSSAIFFCAPAPPGRLPAHAARNGSDVSGNRASGWLRAQWRAGLRGSVRDCSRPSGGSRAVTVRKVLCGSRPGGAIAHIKFASCRKGVRSPLLKTRSVTPVTLHESCQVRACHLRGAGRLAIGHPGGGLSSRAPQAPSGAPWARSAVRAGERSRRPSRARWRALGAGGRRVGGEWVGGSRMRRSDGRAGACRFRVRRVPPRAPPSGGPSSCVPPPGGPPPRAEEQERLLLSDYSSAVAGVKTRESPDPGDPGFRYCGPDGI